MGPSRPAHEVAALVNELSEERPETKTTAGSASWARDGEAPTAHALKATTVSNNPGALPSAEGYPSTGSISPMIGRIAP